MDLVIAERLIREHFEGQPTGLGACEEVLVEGVLMPSLGGDQGTGRAVVAELVSLGVLDLHAPERSTDVGAWGWPQSEEQRHFSLAEVAGSADTSASLI
jgi:hypothetical protein